MAIDALVQRVLAKRQGDAALRPSGLVKGKDLTVDDWREVLARAERGEVTRLECVAVGGIFAVGPRPDAVKDVPCFTSAEIGAMCAAGYKVADARAIFAVKKEFPGSALGEAQR